MKLSNNRDINSQITFNLKYETLTSQPNTTQLIPNTQPLNKNIRNRLKFQSKSLQ